MKKHNCGMLILDERMRKKLLQYTLDETLADLQAVATKHLYHPRAIEHIKLLGEMPPEDGEPFGFVK